MNHKNVNQEILLGEQTTESRGHESYVYWTLWGHTFCQKPAFSTQQKYWPRGQNVSNVENQSKVKKIKL